MAEYIIFSIAALLITLCAAYALVMIERDRLLKEIGAVRGALHALARGEALPYGFRIQSAALNSLWHTVSLLFGRRRKGESQSAAFGELIALSSRIAEAADEGDSIAQELVQLVLTQIRPEARAAAVILRDAAGGARLANLSGLPRARIEELLLIHADSLFAPKGDAFGNAIGWDFQYPERNSLCDYSALGIGLTLSIPLRHAGEIVGALWIGFHCSAGGLTPERRFFIKAIAQHAAASFHAAARVFARTAESERERSFLLGVSHDLRAPGQAALYALTDLISGDVGTLTAEQHLRLSIAERAMRDQLDILGDVLDFTRLQHGHLTVRMSRVTLDPLLRELIDSFSLQAASRGLRLESEAIPNVQLLADAHHVKRILANLITNAIKYTDEGSVRIRFCCSDNILEIRVVDSGIGVPEGERSALFSEFERLSNSDGRPGIGLGLALTKALAERNGGYVFHQPNSDTGSTFGVGIPLADPKADRDLMPNAAQTRRLRSILVIDDDPAACRTTVRHLKHLADELIPAHSSSEALELAETLRPELIVTDLHLGTDNCSTFLAKLRDSDFNAPAIVLTGSADGPVLADLELRFGVGVLQKPIDRESLSCAVSQLAAVSAS